MLTDALRTFVKISMLTDALMASVIKISIFS